MNDTGGPRVVVKSSVAQAANFAAELFRSIVCDAIDRTGSCSVALAGGTTPHALYHLLAFESAVSDLPWNAIDFFFGDERDVPLDHAESNFGMAQRTLMDNVPIIPSRVHPMRADAPDLDAAAAEYEKTVRKLVPAGDTGLPRFNLILLGMGGDGHTASLYPGTDALAEKEKLVTTNYVPVLGRTRMTITYPLINAAEVIILLVTGKDKADVVASLLHQDQSRKAGIPAGLVEPTNGWLSLILDAAAASKTDLTVDNDQ
ncbi:MAG TPA: 6-phosphogluconolactonase [Phycisphaerae bacterium]|nr:6-phosphogluconolactonase [Phycisphaerae bacterium]